MKDKTTTELIEDLKFFYPDLTVVPGNWSGTAEEIALELSLRGCSFFIADRDEKSKGFLKSIGIL